MRFISGKYKGQKIEGYDIKGTRPTMDRVKESLFAMIQEDIKEKNILDLFAGTGSLGLEAMSEGASFCTLVDMNPKCIEAMKKTIKACQIENVTLLKKKYKKALEDFQILNQSFDVIILDPPYEAHLISGTLDFIYKNHLLCKGGIVICEYETEKIESPFPLYKERKYGSKYIKIYKNE